MGQVVHVVLVEWAVEQEGAQAEAERLVDANLPNLPGVLAVDRGASISGEGLESGLDWALVIRFESEQALADYLPHPDHAVVGRHLGDSSSRVVVFDLASRG
jgi:hypothetical protein